MSCDVNTLHGEEESAFGPEIERNRVRRTHPVFLDILNALVDKKPLKKPAQVPATTPAGRENG